MKQVLHSQKKQILADPLAVFTCQYPEVDSRSREKYQLSQLWTHLQSVKKQDRKLLAQTKIISRQIGAAKYHHQSLTKLMPSMQKLSARREQLKGKLKTIEQQILAFFTNRDDKTLANTGELATDRSNVNGVDHMTEITIALLEHEDNAWNDYVAKQPAASIHHLTQWRAVLQKSYGLESYYFFARDHRGQIVGILPLTRLKSRLFGDFLVSMPYFQRGGAIADHPLIEQQLMAAADTEAARLGLAHIEYRDDIAREAYPAQSHKVNMVLALPDSEQALWNNFPAKLRAQIKRPQQLAPQVSTGGKEYLDDFYRVYTRQMRNLGSPCHSKRLIKNMLEYFPDNSWLVVIRLNGKPVSAGLLLGHATTMEIPLAATICEVNPDSINMLLYWEVLKLAIEHDYQCFDFGRSSKNTGTYRFKQQWGAQPRQQYWHYWLGESNVLPSLSPSNPKYALVIKLWKRLPLSLSQWLGPLIIKNIP